MNKLARLGASVALLAAPVISMADTIPTLPDASTYVAALTTGQAGYGSVMFALAIVAVGILVGVKWIKRGRGAA